MERILRFFLRNQILIFYAILVLFTCTSEAHGLKRFRAARPPPRQLPLVKVGKEVISLNVKTRNRGAEQTVDIAPLLSLNGNKKNVGASNIYTSRNLYNSGTRSGRPGLLILRRKSLDPRSMDGFRRPLSSIPAFTTFDGISSQQNRRNFNTQGQPPILHSNKAKLAWIAMLAARQRERALKKLQQNGVPTGKTQYHSSMIPLLHHYKMQKEAADKYYFKYLKTLQLLALATSQTSTKKETSPELSPISHSFNNSPYSSLLNNSTFISTNAVEGDTQLNAKDNSTTSKSVEDQKAAASERSDHPHDEYTTFHREIEKEQRRLLEIFPPPQSEIPFRERTILMVRFPPVPEHHKSKDIIKIKTEYDIDGGITFGGPRWFSFGTPFDPFDHPWYHTTPPPAKPVNLVMAEADKPSCYGVIITQNFVHTPSIRFTNSDPKSLAKYKGDLLNGGPSIVTQLAKALAEGNRISNSYFLSKNVLQGKIWANPETKPPFVIVHLDTYTKKSNESRNLGLDEQVEANYANGTIIYPTFNDPHILASTKFEFHNAKEIDHIFDKPLAILENGYGSGNVPVYPKGINEIKNFLRLMYKVHQDSHSGARGQSDELRKINDKLSKPGLIGSKPLLRHQIADRSVNWLHTSSVGIRSLSPNDDQFPYEENPVIDVSQDDHYLH